MRVGWGLGATFVLSQLTQDCVCHTVCHTAGYETSRLVSVTVTRGKSWLLHNPGVHCTDTPRTSSPIDRSRRRRAFSLANVIRNRESNVALVRRERARERERVRDDRSRGAPLSRLAKRARGVGEDLGDVHASERERTRAKWVRDGAHASRDADEDI